MSSRPDLKAPPRNTSQAILRLVLKSVEDDEIQLADIAHFAKEDTGPD